MKLWVPSYRRKPPIGQEEIDWSHPLARGLVFCSIANAGAGGPQELITRQNPSSYSGAMVPTPQGPCLGFKIVNSTDIAYYQNCIVIPASTPFSCAIRCNVAPFTSSTRYVMGSNRSGTNWINRGFQQDTSNRIGFINSTTGGGQSGGVIAADSTGNFYSYCGTHSGTIGDYATNTKVYKNGIVQSFVAGTEESGAFNIGDGDYFLGNNRTDLTRDLSGTILYAYFWTRTLAPDEAIALHDDPYCFLRPIIRRTYFVSAGGGGDVLLAASLSATATIAASASVDRQIAAAPSATGTLAVALGREATFSANLSATAAIGAQIDRDATLAAPLADAGTLEASVSIDRALAAPIAESATLGVALSVDRSVAAALSATATFAVSIQTAADVTFSAALAASGSLGAAVSADRALAAPLASTGTLAVNIEIQGQVLLSAHLQDVASLGGDLAIDRPLIAPILSSGAFAIALNPDRAFSAALSAAGLLTCDVEFSTGISASLTAITQILTSISVERPMAASLAGSATLAVNLEKLLLPSEGVDWTVPSCGRRWTAPSTSKIWTLT